MLRRIAQGACEVYVVTVSRNEDVIKLVRQLLQDRLQRYSHQEATVLYLFYQLSEHP